MGGKLKERSESSAKGGAICRPVADGWQIWVPKDGDHLSLRNEAPDLAGLKPSPDSLIAVPVRRAFSLAVWVPGDDPSILGDLVHTQLEMRGLAARTREETSFAWREIAREGNELLVHVIVLPAHLAPRYWHGDVTAYAVSPDCLPLAPDSVTIWREEGTWVAAVKRGDNLLHFQALAEPDPGPGMALEIMMMFSPLEAGGMVDGPPSVVFYRSPGQEVDLSALSRAGERPVAVEDFPPPVRPAALLACTPLPVRLLQAEKAKSAQRQRLAFAGAAVYLALVLALAGNTLWLHWKTRRLQAEIDRDASAVTATREAMSRWQSMQPALEPATYPLEVLYQTARLLPEDGVRLTLFDMNLERVLIQGEASTLAAALKFQDDLKKNSEIGDFYEWSAESPKQLPNGSTRFQIDGVKRGSSAQKENESADI